MFRWFKKKQIQATSLLSADHLLPRLLNATALVQAIANAAGSYAKAAQQGDSTFPAFKRGNPNVRDVWEDTRKEAIFPFFQHGAADLALLAELQKQPQLFAAVAEEQSHYMSKSPSGNPINDTAQAIGLAFEYLRKTSMAAGGGYASEEQFLKNFERSSKMILPNWKAYEAAVKQSDKHSLPDLPPFMIDVFWEEVTVKSKAIGIAVIYGHGFDENFDSLVAEIRDAMARNGKDKAKTRQKSKEK